MQPASFYKATRYQNAALEYYLGLTNSPYLHYGYWETPPASPTALTPADLRVAQQAYADRLLALIPDAVKAILDVGCGIGGNAAYLLSQGYTVEGLAPDSFQQQQFVQRTEGRAPFHLSRFEDFQTTQTYDLLLFSESSQYLAAIDLAQRSRQFLKPDGYLLIADMFRKDAAYQEGIFSNCVVIQELELALKQQGFELIQVDDISANITPTIDLCLNYFQTFGLTTLKYIAQLVQIAVPPLYKLGQMGFQRWLKAPIDEAMQAREVFEQHLCYQIRLWHLPA